MDKTSILSVFFTFLVLTGRLATFIATPLWLDYFKPETRNGSEQNTTTSATTHDSSTLFHTSQPFYSVLVQYVTGAVFWFVVLVSVMLCCPRYIGQKEKTYPKKLLIIPGVSMAISSILFNYSVSGSRTATYLQAVLGNFSIPMQFTVRFLILRRRPTLVKAICALVVILAEFVCLLPKIFPWVEPGSQQSEDGGATGAGAVLWPLCFVLSMVPFTTTNALIEGGVKDTSEDSSGRATQINMIFYLFWYHLGTALGTAALFWADFVPGFGTSSSVQVFWEKFVFNLECSVGRTGCGVEVVVLFWITVTGSLLAALSIAYLLRYSEGANYMMVVMTLRSPLLLLFWTLFDESPFTWHPHVHLSTWLSIAALAIMIPAVIIYNISAPEKVVSRTEKTVSMNTDGAEDENKPLLQRSEQSENTENVGFGPSTSIQR